MKLYNITIEVDGVDTTSRWSGYTAQIAIAQAFLYYAQNGARSTKVLEIYEIA